MPLSNITKISSAKDKSTLTSEDPGSVIMHSEEDRYRMIAEAAYYRALARGFAGGDVNDDWYAAEAEIEQICGR